MRPADANVAAAIARLSAHDLPDRRTPTSPETFQDDVLAFLHEHGLEHGKFTSLVKDMRDVAEAFFTLSGHRPVKFRLLTTDQNDCQRFHVDYRHLRLLCTYQGPGTQWLRNAQVNRDAEASGASNAEILRFGDIQHFEPFWVGIFKGSAHPGNANSGLVHRSPPIEGSGQVRVLFCLDC